MLPVKTTLEPNVADFGTSIPMQVPNPDPLKPLNRPSDRVQHTFNIRTLIITNTTLGGGGGAPYYNYSITAPKPYSN